MVETVYLDEMVCKILPKSDLYLRDLRLKISCWNENTFEL